MNLRSFSEIFSSSIVARKLSLGVFFCFLVAQLLVVVPFLWVQYQNNVSTLLENERARLQSILHYAEPSLLGHSVSLLSTTLLGVLITDVAGNPRVSEGDLPEIDEFDLNKNQALSNRSGSIDALWFLQAPSGRVLTTARISTDSAVSGVISNALKFFGMAVLTSLIGSVFFLRGIHHAYIVPLRRLAGKLHDSRIGSAGSVPETIEYTTIDDLNPLADEFNSLIEVQQRAARQVKVKQQYLEFAAHHDPLTHLPNRLMFEDRLKKTVANSLRSNAPFVLFLVDLDNFKFFNDQYGHLVGDRMVAEVGNRLHTMMRDMDHVARLDGDEFVVIQKDVGDRASAQEFAQRLMSIATAPYEYKGFTLKVSVTVGISCFPLDVHDEQDEEMMGEEIVNNASVALQEAKSSGKNQYQLFNEKMRSRLTARIRLEQDLKLALNEGQFEVYYQPKINIHTRQITGAEALVRWKHPTEGFISPEVFVPVAEEAGMIIELGEWILRTACRETRKLQQLGYSTLNVAVNISAVQFTDGNLLPMVSRALRDTRLTPKFLELEITESAVMHDPEEVINSLHELSRFGMSLAIDDFGTGYSSLAYLKRFPVDTLKIDRAFITDISSDHDDVAIVEAVLGLGKHFNMKVVAEGVEDEEQLQFLRVQGCDIAQGYYISKPMPLVVYAEWLKSWPQGVQGVHSLDDSDSVNVLKMPPQARRFGT